MLLQRMIFLNGLHRKDSRTTTDAKWGQKFTWPFFSLIGPSELKKIYALSLEDHTRVAFVLFTLYLTKSGTGKLRNETKTKSNEICKVRKRNPTKWKEICKVRKRNPAKWNEICKVRKRNPTKRNDEICKVRKENITKRNEIYKVRKQY